MNFISFAKVLAKKEVVCNCLNSGICENDVCFCAFPFVGEKCEKKLENSKYFFYDNSKYLILFFFFFGFFLFFSLIYFWKRLQGGQLVARKKKESGAEVKYEQISNTDSEVWKII
jgi:hypothetical protein